MKASNASLAAAFVSAIQISCNARLALGCWLFGNFASTFAVLCTQQRCSRVLGQTSPAESRRRSKRAALKAKRARGPVARLRGCRRIRSPHSRPSSKLVPIAKSMAWFAGGASITNGPLRGGRSVLGLRRTRSGRELPLATVILRAAVIVYLVHLARIYGATGPWSLRS